MAGCRSSVVSVLWGTNTELTQKSVEVNQFFPLLKCLMEELSVVPVRRNPQDFTNDLVVVVVEVLTRVWESILLPIKAEAHRKCGMLFCWFQLHTKCFEENISVSDMHILVFWYACHHGEGHALFISLWIHAYCLFQELSVMLYILVGWNETLLWAQLWVPATPLAFSWHHREVTTLIPSSG